jgi:hypothetical protein
MCLVFCGFTSACIASVGQDDLPLGVRASRECDQMMLFNDKVQGSSR